MSNRSLIIYVWQQSQSNNGTVIESMDTLGAIAKSAQVPIYNLSTSLYAGGGVIGGYINTPDANGTKLAQIVQRIFSGTPARDIAVEGAPTVPEFDWRELQRFGLSESQLPAGSIVRFKQVTFWSQYKGRIIGAVAIMILEGLLIAGLLIERGRKKRATNKLSESEQRFAKAFKANPQPMSLTTLAEGRYLEVNESFLQMSGFTRGEVIGRTSVDLGIFESPNYRTDVLVEPLLKSGGVRNLEMEFRTSSGATRTLLSSAEIIELAGVKCILKASSDITERNVLERELQRSEREFSTLVENSPDVIARLDRDLRYTYMSPGVERTTGVPASDFIGRTPDEIVLENYDWQSFVSSCRQAVETKTTVHRALKHHDRNYWTRIIPELSPEGEVDSVMTISQDVTDRVRAQEELVELTGRLFRIQDEERRRIARELHDGTAQNLFGITMNLAKLGQLTMEKPEAQKLIDECETLGNESLQEIRTLSYLLHPPLLDQVGLVGALKWYVEGFSKRSGIYVDVTAQPMERLPAETEMALFRVVQESLSNVSRHSGSGTASVRLERLNGEVSLTIEDRGCGLRDRKALDAPAELVQMGVGIPGMRQRLVQLGGRLELNSNNSGTTVTAVVPFTDGVHDVANSTR